MRNDIYEETNGERRVSIHKAIGDGYDNFWYTNCHARYRLLMGARNTKKSYTVGYEIICKVLSDPRRNILVCRQNYVDIQQSIYEGIVRCACDLGVEKYFTFNKQPLLIRYNPTGQVILFRGLNNPTSINSITVATGYITDVYIEEAYEIQSYSDFRKLDGSLRGKMPDGLQLQITMMFNPWSPDHWLYTEFFKGRLEPTHEYFNDETISYVDYYDPTEVIGYGVGIYLMQGTYRLNEFRDAEIYDRAMKELKEKAPDIYYCEGLGFWGAVTGKCYECFGDQCLKTTTEILNNYSIINFAIGVDFGISDGAGKMIKVTKGEDVEKKVRAATTMCLCAVDNSFSTALCIDEYFHSNIPGENSTNTDNQNKLTGPEQIQALVHQIQKWIEMYGQSESQRYVVGPDGQQRKISSVLMKGTINVYIDNADSGGFRDSLQSELNRFGMWNVQCYACTKKSVASRIDFDNLLMAYGEFIVNKDRCPNLIRELRNARRGEKGEPRETGNDHLIDAKDYAMAALLTDIKRWKTFKEH